MNTGDGAFVIDEDQRIILWNDAAEEILGYSSKEAIGRFCFDLIQGRDRQGRLSCQHHCHIIERVRGSETIASRDLVVVHRDGRQVSVSMSTITLIEDSNRSNNIRAIHLFRLLEEAPIQQSSLRIHLLGPTSVWRADGAFVQGNHWRRAKVRSLLAFLAVNQGQPLHRTTLINALWPHLFYDSALKNLNTTIYELRHSLEPALRPGEKSSYILYGNNYYILDSSRSNYVDVDDFETKLKLAQREADSERATALYRQAITLYQGDFLADIGSSTTAWYFAERQRLREQYLIAVEKLGNLYESQLALAEARELYLRVLAFDSCHEVICRRLIRLCLRQGDITAAKLHYHYLVEALATELNVLPEQKTQQLYAEIYRKR